MEMVAMAMTALGALYLAGSVSVLGRRTKGYNQVRDTISELGEVGAPHQRAVAIGVFLPMGLTLLGVAGLLHGTSNPAAVLAACLSFGYLVAAVFPCDPGSPISGTPRQAVHNLGGAVQYIGGGAALWALASTGGVLFRPLGLVVFAAAALLTALPAWRFRGLVQRIAEAALFFGLLVAAGKA